MLGALIVAASAPARAEPKLAPTLGDLLAAARRSNLDVREQASVVDEREATARVERGSLWPRLSVSADYLHNQRDVAVDLPGGTGAPTVATIQPYDQLDATIELDIPLIDLGARRRTAAAVLDGAAARATRAVTVAEVERNVVRAYYQWAGGTALLGASLVARQAASDNVAILESRLRAGLAAELDVARAHSQVARADQTIADAELTIATARRTLHTLTAIEPAGDVPPLPSSTTAEAPLAIWLGAIGSAPEVASATASAEAADARASASRSGYAPIIGLVARERLTNAAGFGSDATWTVGVNATWQLDRATAARVDQSAATVATAEIRIAHASLDVRDRIVDAWNQIDALRARTAAAEAQAAADHLAERVASGKLGGGQATQLDVVLAERDALNSDVALIQARADLAAARALLRLATGAQP
ncbi:MAG TPA: TolC family protein [Kofleriaceae bacterium]